MAVLGCSRAKPAESPPPPVAPTPAPAPEPEPEPPPAMPPKHDPMSTWKPGATVTVQGRVATVIWQHLVKAVPGKQAAYFDLEEEGSRQTVVYWKDPPTCDGLIEVTGTVIEVRGAPKRPGAKPSLADESYSELQIDVATARCL